MRQSGAPGDVGALLADRVALLDRPAFAGFFDTTGSTRPFSFGRALEHPLRVRIDLPERGHAEASRMLARLVLAQFTECAVARRDRSLFACLVLDDASHAVTPESRARHPAPPLGATRAPCCTLRTLDDVPEALRSALLGAVGCRMAFAGRDHLGRSAVRRGVGHGVGGDAGRHRPADRRRRADDQGACTSSAELVTGKAVTTQSVTVRKVERERWSASDLANAVPPGHAVLSVTSVRGEHAPPVLVDLRG